MSYRTTRIKIFLSNLLNSVLDFFEAVSFHTKKSFRLFQNHETTRKFSRHVSKAKNKLINNSLDNIFNWNDRFGSSESFRIHENDV